MSWFVEKKPTLATPEKKQEEEQVIGKSTRSGALPVGIKTVDSAGVGQERYRGDNFLTDQQRPILVAEYFARVNAGLSSYLSACVSEQIELEVKEEEKFPIVATLLLAAAGFGVESVLARAATLLHHTAVERLADIGISGVDSRKVAERVGKLSEKSVEFVIKQSVDRAKDGVKKSIGAAAKGEKQKALSFMDFVKDSSMPMFQNFREWPIGRVSDTQLLQLNEAFSAENQLPSMYRRHIRSILAMYRNSPAKDIGTSTELGVRDGRMVDINRTVQVAYIVNGRNTPQLGYVRRETYQASGEIVEKPEDFLGYVEPEMRDVALATQGDMPMKTFTVNFPAMNLTPGIPRLDLGKKP